MQQILKPEIMHKIIPKKEPFHKKKDSPCYRQSPPHRSWVRQSIVACLNGDSWQAVLLAQVHHACAPSQSSSLQWHNSCTALPLQWRDRSGVDRIPYYVFRHLFPTIFRCRYYLIPSLRLCQEYIYSTPKLYLYYIDIYSYLILSGSKTNSTDNQNRSQCFGYSYFISHNKVSG